MKEAGDGVSKGPGKHAWTSIDERRIVTAASLLEAAPKPAWRRLRLDVETLTGYTAKQRQPSAGNAGPTNEAVHNGPGMVVTVRGAIDRSSWI